MTNDESITIAVIGCSTHDRLAQLLADRLPETHVLVINHDDRIQPYNDLISPNSKELNIANLVKIDHHHDLKSINRLNKNPKYSNKLVRKILRNRKY